MQSKLIEVSEYHLSSDDVQIVFHNGDDDTRKLEYNGRTFEGRALHRETTALGLVVSAALETIPDLHEVFLSVAVPQAHRRASERSTSVGTFAVFTTVRTSIGGPGLVPGQLQTYKVVPLKGNAW